MRVKEDTCSGAARPVTIKVICFSLFYDFVYAYFLSIHQYHCEVKALEPVSTC